jgi:hypothetical protein
LKGQAGLAVVAVGAEHGDDFVVFHLAEVEVEAAHGAEGRGSLQSLQAQRFLGELAYLSLIHI